ncbi:MAG: FAD-dependent oxidoreductase [Opitutaceae bacterium]|jgi:hypothetical protein
MTRRALGLFLFAVITGCVATAVVRAETPPPLVTCDFARLPLGDLPEGWRDHVDYRPTRNWAVDERGFLRVLLKDYVGDPIDGDRLRRRQYLEKNGMAYFAGLLTYDGPLPGDLDPAALGDTGVAMRFRKTPDRDVFAAAILRFQDRDNYYSARVSADGRLEIIRTSQNHPASLSSVSPVRHLAADSVWTLEFSARGTLLAARLLDEKGSLVSSAWADDNAFATGAAGISATTFAGINRLEIRFAASARKAPPRAVSASLQPGKYPVVRAAENPDALRTPFDRIATDYDVVVSGAGTGGVGAALQAARMGARVLLLEETDLIGGQMANAGVTSMDDGGIWGKNPVRGRGVYREFHESAALHYYARDRDPFTAYRFNLQSEGGYEPHVARAILCGLVDETRRRAPINGRAPVLDLAVRARVIAVDKTGDTVTGATLEESTESGPRRRDVRCRVLVDATEYGDVIPLTGARYRVGTSLNNHIAPDSPLQAHTWTGVIREYPEGLPDRLKIATPPDGYEQVARQFRSYQLAGEPVWGGEHRGYKGPRAWWVYVAWRGMPDSSSPATGAITEIRHTRTGLNGGNDYPVTAATVEDSRQRLKDELQGINRTLSIIYWFQHELGLPWSVAEDEGYSTPCNLARMKARGVRPDLLPIAASLPQWPYVREARRIVGVRTLRGVDLYLRDRGDESARHWASAVSINDYSFDLHGSRDSLEPDLDEAGYINATGPFGVPFAAFIPEKIDGFLPAEKNFSQSRLANGATRLQPSTMLNGQAVGAIAAIAALRGVQPRAINIIETQAALLAAGDPLLSRWYQDVPYASPLWRAGQLLALYGLLDRPGAMPRLGPLGEQTAWGAGEPLAAADLAATRRLFAKIAPAAERLLPAAPAALTRADFALLATDLLVRHGRYLAADPAPYEDPGYPAALAKARAKKAKIEQRKE